MNQTIEYYDKNAQAFVDRTLTRDMSSQYARFLQHVSDGGSILDVGCGSGRDLKYFSDQGYTVQGVDASQQMVEFARNHSLQSVDQLRFDEIKYKEKFDGIWACASLLHVPKSDLHGTLCLLSQALKPSGVMYISLKEGEGEEILDDRFFSLWTNDSLRALIELQTSLDCIDVWNEEPYPQRKDHWICALVRKTK